MKFLAERSVNVNSQDENGDTALHLVVRSQVIALKNPFELNREWITRTTSEIIEIIKQSGEKVMANKQGGTCIQTLDFIDKSET